MNGRYIIDAPKVKFDTIILNSCFSIKIFQIILLVSYGNSIQILSSCFASEVCHDVNKNVGSFIVLLLFCM
jgi:hypothetical protein